MCKPSASPLFAGAAIVPGRSTDPLNGTDLSASAHACNHAPVFTGSHQP